jgi:hypothetical protein
MRFRIASMLLSITCTLALLPLVGCDCAPTGETDRELALLGFGPSVTRVELPGTIHIRDGMPEVEAVIADCAGTALEGATIEIRDAEGVSLPNVGGSGGCSRTVAVTGARDSNVEIRVVVTLPSAPAVETTGEIELVTFSDVCASVGASDIVDFGS